MIGVGYELLHRDAPRRVPVHAQPPMQTYTCVVATDGRRGWTGYQDVVLDDNDFEEIGKSLADRESSSGKVMRVTPSVA